MNENTCRPKLRSAIVSERGFLSFDMQPCLLCAGLVTSYLSKWSTGTSYQSFCKTVREYMASGVTLPPLLVIPLGYVSRKYFHLGQMAQKLNVHII